jgi:4'-phosphopantetheinyl transferase
MSMDAVVHLACATVSALRREAPPERDWLSASEHARFAALQAEARRAQFLAARWQARRLLAQVEGGTPLDWPLEAPSDAPPHVAKRRDLLLSISHSGERTACALASQPVGLDLEQPRRRRRDIDGLIALCCTPREQAMFAHAQPAEREALFHELWTVKEACLKRRGDWVAPRRLAQLDCTPDVHGEVRCWRGAGWHLAVTAKRVRWWTEEPAPSQRWAVHDAA